MQEEYEEGVKVSDLLGKYNFGIQTKRDSLVISEKDDDLLKVLNDFEDLDEGKLKKKYPLKDSSGWTIKKAKESVLRKIRIKNISYIIITQEHILGVAILVINQ